MISLFNPIDDHRRAKPCKSAQSEAFYADKPGFQAIRHLF